MSTTVILSTIVLSITAITAVGAFFTKVYRIAKRIDAAVGVDESGRTISERMTKVEYQLWENGGGSMRDDVNLIREVSQQNTTEIGIVKELVMTIIHSQQEALEKRVERIKNISA